MLNDPGWEQCLIAAIFGQVYMADRKKFFASLNASNGPATGSAGDSLVSKGCRKEFLASLSPGASSSKVPGDGQSVVSFDLASILEFKGASSISASYKQQREPPRLRPNYDSSERKLYANPEVHQKHLGDFY